MTVGRISIGRMSIRCMNSVSTRPSIGHRRMLLRLRRRFYSVLALLYREPLAFLLAEKLWLRGCLILCLLFG